MADLHLDSPFIGYGHLPRHIYERIKESTFISFSRIIHLAIAEKVDFVVISGDIYDNENRSLRAQVRFRDGVGFLNENNIKVFIIHGNHDHLGGNWISLDWPENVNLFESETVEMKQYIKNGEPLVNIYGFSYCKRQVTKKMSSYYKKINTAPFHIGLLHGSIEGNKEHNPYAPFRLNELREKGFDYWALGHIHKSEVLSEDPLIIYPGNIQGRHIKEIGEKGCYLVELSDYKENTYHFHPTADIIWDKLVLDISKVETIDGLLDYCREKMDDRRKVDKGVLLTIEFIGEGRVHEFLQNHDSVQELLEILLENEEDRNSFVWITEFHVKTMNQWDREKLKTDTHFIGDLLKFTDEYKNIDNALSTLFKHYKAKRYMDALSEEDAIEIIESAERLLINELLKNSNAT